MKCNRIGFHLLSEQKGRIKIPTTAANMENAFQYHQSGASSEGRAAISSDYAETDNRSGFVLNDGAGLTRCRSLKFERLPR